ncbi:MAG TPA: metallophosphoesterase [Candidatus Dormibacteraeota bacterium]|nr:metallophosphoesterase [Candidatus Dormibacteraeota bacterium]
MTVERRVGLTHPSEVRCATQLSKRWDTFGNQPLPSGDGSVITPDKVGIDDIGDGLSFLLLGDCGGIEDPNPQKAVAAAMTAAVQADPSIKFVAIAGDVCYFDGDPAQYMPQVWQPWAYVKVPFIAVPGNHDGDPTDGVTGAGIASFMANWCDPQGPRAPLGDLQLEFGRDTQTLPYCYYAIRFKELLLIGLYSNVASGGYLDATQQAFLTSTMESATEGLPVMVYLHHPPYSVDAMHGGSLNMLEDLDRCFTTAGRWPTVVAAGHIHDAQRFTRTTSSGPVTYLVTGNGGYHNLHAIAGDYVPGMQLPGGVVCDYADASQWGFLKITIRGGHMIGSYIQVPLSGPVTEGADTFTL